MRLAPPVVAPDAAADKLRSRWNHPWPLAALTAAAALAVYVQPWPATCRGPARPATAAN